VRTTLTLDPDTQALLTQLMRERGMTLKAAVNYAIRAGLAGAERPVYRMTTVRMGQPTVPLDKALRLAGELEDDQLIDRLAVRK
jgi:hypothetical protein